MSTVLIITTDKPYWHLFRFSLVNHRHIHRIGILPQNTVFKATVTKWLVIIDSQD